MRRKQQTAEWIIFSVIITISVAAVIEQISLASV